MTLNEYLEGSQRMLPAPGIRGNQTQWLSFTHLEITTGHLWAGDPCIANAEDGCTIQVPPGMYQVEAKCMDFQGPRFISRLRVRSKEATRPSLGNEVGEAGTDSAQIGVCDIKQLDSAIGNSHEAAQQQIEEQSYTSDAFGVIELSFGSTARMPFVASGLGDGMGPVFELLTKGKIVGMELEFIEPSYTHEEVGAEAMTSADSERYAKIAALISSGSCMYCASSGQCYCIRKGSGDPRNCARCGGNAKCHVCRGSGRAPQSFPP